MFIIVIIYKQYVKLYNTKFIGLAHLYCVYLRLFLELLVFLNV